MILQPENLFYAALTAFVTVFFLVVVRIFGKLPVPFVGPDLNLLTYGFLWDTTVKALRGAEYWPRFQPLAWNLNRGTTLFVIATFNLLALAANMKLAHRVEKLPEGFTRKWLLRPLITALGVLSLIVFLWIQAAWEVNK
jgi:hypothetical protein